MNNSETKVILLFLLESLLLQNPNTNTHWSTNYHYIGLSHVLNNKHTILISRSNQNI